MFCTFTLGYIVKHKNVPIKEVVRTASKEMRCILLYIYLNINSRKKDSL